tara:strand:- start:17939 stop:18184 length:246 start_codon:yes stop_codon:yes gene_type:complete
MKPDIKSDYEVSFYNTDKKAIVHYSYYKRVISSDYDVPDDESEVEIDKIEIDGIDMTDILFEIADDWTMQIEDELLEHCEQ